MADRYIYLEEVGTQEVKNSLFIGLRDQFYVQSIHSQAKLNGK